MIWIDCLPLELQGCHRSIGDPRKRKVCPEVSSLH